MLRAMRRHRRVIGIGSPTSGRAIAGVEQCHRRHRAAAPPVCCSDDLRLTRCAELDARLGCALSAHHAIKQRFAVRIPRRFLGVIRREASADAAAREPVVRVGVVTAAVVERRDGAADLHLSRAAAERSREVIDREILAVAASVEEEWPVACVVRVREPADERASCE